VGTGSSCDGGDGAGESALCGRGCARVVSAIGTDARSGTILTTTVAERARPRFLAAIGIMELSRTTLELREENRASYLRALMMFARVETESNRVNVAAANA
jgi:hypothetical protein